MMGLKLLESNHTVVNDGNGGSVELTNDGLSRVRSTAVESAGPDSSPCTVELVRHMLDSSASAANTLNDLLLYEKIEDNLLSIEPTRVHLFDVVGNSIAPFLERATQTGIRLSWDLTSIESIYTQLDVSKFGQVLKTLISNAIKFTPPNGSVHVSAVCIYNKPQVTRHVPVPTRSLSTTSLTSTFLEGQDRPPAALDFPAPMKPLFFRNLGFQRSSGQLQATDSFSSSDTTVLPSPLPTYRSRSDSAFSTAGTTDLHHSKVAYALMMSTIGSGKERLKPPSGPLFRISIEDSGHGLSEVVCAYMFK